MKWAESVLEVFRPGGRPLPSEAPLNFERQMRVALGSCSLAESGSDASYLTAFGAAGNGKSTFAAYLGTHLQALGYYVAWLDCLRASSLTDSGIDELAQRLSSLYASEEVRPLLVIANGLEAFDEPTEGSEAAGELITLLTGNRGESWQGRVVTLLVTSDPKSVVSYLSPILPILMFFDWPSPSGITSFLRQLQITHASEVAGCLLEIAEEQGIVYTCEGIIKGTKSLKDTRPEYSALSTRDIAEGIFSFCRVMPKRDQDEYLHDNRSYIVKARATADEWTRSFAVRVNFKYAEVIARLYGQPLVPESIRMAETWPLAGTEQEYPSKYAGYEAQSRAALAVGYRCATSSRAFGLLLFGPPGTGKSRFAESLVQNLRERGIHYRLLFVPCGRLATASPDQARDQLSDVERYVRADETTPLAIVLDDLEAIALSRVGYPGGAALSHWLMGAIRWSKEAPGARLFLGICNHPSSVDDAILTAFDAAIYFGPSVEDQVSEALEEKGIQDVRMVASKYIELCREGGLAYTARSVIQAIESVQLLDDDWMARSPEELAAEIFAQSRSLPSESMSDYEKENAGLIASSNAFVQAAQLTFEQLKEHQASRDAISAA